MPLEIEFPRSRVARQSSAERREAHDSLVIGLINNMPEAALEATEVQFASLLRAAAAPLSARLRLSSLPEVPRGRAGLDRVNGDAYWPIDELLREGLDALIVTGAEPCAPRLSDEPYWERIGELLRWAEANTSS